MGRFRSRNLQKSILILFETNLLFGEEKLPRSTEIFIALENGNLLDLGLCSCSLREISCLIRQLKRMPLMENSNPSIFPYRIPSRNVLCRVANAGCLTFEQSKYQEVLAG